MYRKLLLTAAAAALALSSCSRERIPQGTGLLEVADGVYAYVAEGPSSPEGLGANAGFVVGGEAVLVVDTRFTPRLAEELAASIRSVTDLPVEYVVNTHYHPDHVWGNRVFSETGADLLARPETAVEIERYTPVYMEYYRQNKPDVYSMIEGVRAVVPDTVGGDRTVIDLGGLEVELLYFGPAHTAGDLVVSVPARKTVFTGGLVSNGYHPNMADQGADFGNWLAALGRIGRIGPEVVVPGQGQPGPPELIDRHRRYMVDLMARCVEAIRNGQSMSESVLTMRVPGAEGYLQENLLPFNVQAVYREKLLETVSPPFRLDIPPGFFLSDGAGTSDTGMLQWVFQSETGYLELEVAWRPTRRKDVIAQDIRDEIARYGKSSGMYLLETTGGGWVSTAAGDFPVLEGRWEYRRSTNAAGSGPWRWTMILGESTLYSVRYLTNSGGETESEEENIATLEQIVSTFRLERAAAPRE